MAVAARIIACTRIIFHLSADIVEKSSMYRIGEPMLADSPYVDCFRDSFRVVAIVVF